MRLFKLSVLCLLVSACVFGTSQKSTFYTLIPQQADALSDRNLYSVGVNRVQLPKYIDRPQIVTQGKDSAEIVMSEYNRWIESLSVLSTRVLVEDLNILLPKTQIQMNQFTTEKFNRIVSVEVTDMNAVLGDKTVLSVRYTIQNAAGRTFVHQKSTYTVEIGNTYDDLAKGYSTLWMKLSEDIAKSLIK